MQDGAGTVGFVAQELWDRAQKLWDLTRGVSSARVALAGHLGAVGASRGVVGGVVRAAASPPHPAARKAMATMPSTTPMSAGTLIRSW